MSSETSAVLPDDADGARFARELAATQVRINNLERDLVNARMIGAAIGIIMASEWVTYDAAFIRLVTVSQRDHRKLRNIADDV